MNKKIFYLILIIAFICSLLISCGPKSITDDEVQHVRDTLAGDWRFADDYLNQFEDSSSMNDFTITILDDGTWFFFAEDGSYISDLNEYYIDYAYDDKYSVDFVFSNTSDVLSCIYSEKTDNLFQTEETEFTISIYDIMERI